jgi:hypothetical protein
VRPWCAFAVFTVAAAGCGLAPGRRWWLGSTCCRAAGERHPITAFGWGGVVLLAAVVVAVLLALSGLSGVGLDAAAVGLLGVAAALAAGFVLREGRAASALIEVALLRSKRLLAGLGAAFTGGLLN